MHTHRFISLLIAISLLAVTVLVVRQANATANTDSAIRSNTAWAKGAEAEANPVDSATRSYIAQAKAAACSVDAANSLGLDSATRSYIAWGLASQAKNNTAALCR